MGTRRSRHNKGRKRFTFRDTDELRQKEYACARCGTPTNGHLCEGCYRRGGAFLSSERARSLRVCDVEVLSEAAARDLFKQIRWSESHGQPVCPHCDCAEYYSIERDAGQRWRCAKCHKDYSVLTGTPVAHKKVPFKTVLLAIASLVETNGDATASQVREACGLNSKSVFSLKQRIMAAREAAGPLQFEIGKQRYKNGMLLSTRTWWTDAEKEALRTFAAANAEPEHVAVALGRSQSSILAYGRELKIKFPVLWGGRKPRIIRQKREPKVILQFPYIQRPRPEHSDLLAVNAIIPKSLPSYVRADIVQEIMLAILEGKTTVAAICSEPRSARWFVSQFYKNNYEQAGHAVSLTGFDDDERSYDEIASSIAAREWHVEQMNDKRRSFDSLARTFHAPTQMEDVFANQVHRRQFEHHVNNRLLSFEEVEQSMSTEL